MSETLFGNFAKQLDPSRVTATLNQNMQALLQSVAPSLNMVSREEFEVQQALLVRLRLQVDTLAQQVATLEQAYGIAGSRDESRPDS